MQPGGKGANQVVAARQDGAAVHMVGAVGQDGLAPLALEILEQTGVGFDTVRRLAGISTGCASIGLDRHGRNQIIVALGARLLLGSGVVRPGPGSWAASIWCASKSGSS